MKILFTADWHIKLGQKNVPIEWQKNRYNLLFDNIIDLVKSNNINALIVGGDIFDRLPSIDEIELYFTFISKLNTIKEVDVVIYPGNHEALKKNTTFLSALKNATNNIASNTKIIDAYETLYDSIDCIPYNKLKEFTKDGWPGINTRILCTHVRGNIPPHVKSEVDLELFNKWDLVLAGDLHSHSNSQRNIIYPGSPITTSFHRSKVDTGVIVLDTSTLEWKFIKLDLPQLIRKTVSDVKDMLVTEYDHTIYELEGDILNLASISTNSDILDKKVVKKTAVSKLPLNSNMSIQEELKLYFSTILNLGEDNIKILLETLDDYIKTTSVE